MKQLTLIACMLLAAAYNSYAQDEQRNTETRKPRSKTDEHFNMPQTFINVRDYVYLRDKAKMIIELNNPEQYKELKNMHELLLTAMREIAFYRDSLENGSGSVRIDYAVDEAFPFSKIRFKKHPPDGDIFMNRQNDIARLKVEQDTVRIYVRHNPVLERNNDTRNNPRKNYRYNVNHARMYQITFCVNKYTDLIKLAEDKTLLSNISDTLLTTRKKEYLSNPFSYPSSASFRPFGPDTIAKGGCNTCAEQKRFKLYSGLSVLEDPGYHGIIRRSDVITMEGNFGTGLIRNAFAPMAEVGIVLVKQGRRMYNDRYLQTSIGAFVSSYYIFERNTNNEFSLKDNVFVNLKIANDKREKSVGVGYLLSGKGNYFRGVTTKVFFDIRMLKNGLTLSPEIIFTNDFKQIFPGLTLKVF